MSVSWCLLLLLFAFLPSFTLLRTGISTTTLLGASLQFGDHLSHVKHHILTYIRKQQSKINEHILLTHGLEKITHTGLTRGKLLQAKAAVSLLQLHSDSTPELGISVPLPRVHLVVLPTQTGSCTQNPFWCITIMCSSPSPLHRHWVRLRRARLGSRYRRGSPRPASTNTLSEGGKTCPVQVTGCTSITARKAQNWWWTHLQINNINNNNSNQCYRDTVCIDASPVVTYWATW